VSTAKLIRKIKDSVNSQTGYLKLYTAKGEKDRRMRRHKASLWIEG
jgi:hypothetical protein